jgi:predicted acetyltransferase
MKSRSLSISPVRTAAGLRAAAVVMSRSYMGKPKGFMKYLRGAGAKNVLVATDRGTTVAGLVMLPSGAWFGGRAVPTIGIACVATAPEARGHGLAPALMAACVREMSRRGAALSTLFPSTVPLYRGAGWEHAGLMHTWKIPARDFVFHDRELDVRVAGKRDAAVLRKLHDTAASRTSGLLKRTEWFWKRVLAATAEEPRETHLALRNGRPEGYVVFALRESKLGRWFDLGVRDFVSTTPAATRRLLTVLSDHRSMCEWVSGFGSPSDLIHLLPQEQRIETERSKRWMMRIVDVKRALEQRGWPAGLDAEVSFDIEDPVVPANAGKWRLRVKDGRGRAERGGSPRVELPIRGLAPLYSGFMSPEELRLAGLIEGPEAELARLRTFFAGPAPYTTDGF